MKHRQKETILTMQLQELLSYQNIVVQCHNAPDADAIASAYAVYRYLQTNGKTARLIYGSPLGECNLIQKGNLRHMIKDLGLENVLQHADALEDPPDLLLYVDCHPGESNVRLFGPMAYPLRDLPKKEEGGPEVPAQEDWQTYAVPVDFSSWEDVLAVFGAKAVAVIDHHKVKFPKNLPPMQELQSYKSCSTILWTMLRDAGIDLTQNPGKSRKLLATALYYGLYTDSSELQELSGGQDSDLLDKLNSENRNENLIFRWNTASLSLAEMKSVGQALFQYDYYDSGRFAIMEMKSADGCYLDQNLLGIIGDLLIRVDKIDTCVAFCEQATCFRLSVRTCTPEALATDIIKFITAGVGGGGGHPRKTGGDLEKDKLRVAFEAWCGFRPETDEDLCLAARQLLADRMRAYYSSFDVFRSGRDETSQKIGLDAMDLYEKRTDGSPIGYIPVTEEGLYAPGTVLTIRSLEGDMVETVSEDTYLMFGVDGEPYTNSRKAFLAQYEDAPEPYVFPGQYLPHITSAKCAGDAQQEKLDADALQAHIHACRPKPGHRVHARKLLRRAKVFSDRRPDGYLLGEPGDWLVARAGNTSHVHIVKAESFPKLYFQVSTDGD